jgi:mannose-6-phosphate isomerase
MLKFAPFYQPVPWGGRRLAEKFGRDTPEGPVGESWELVELPERHSTVCEGPRAGKKLGDLWREGELGGSAKGPFPFLLKWIDAAQSLSVQVHPDEAACKKLGAGRPKTEAWYIVEADPQASLLIGHYPGLDAAAMRQAIAGDTLKKWLFDLQPHPGDIYLLPAGTLHAIGSGFLLLEVQQPSDTTFRLYDWGRVGADGKPRQLHIDEAAQSVAFDRPGPPRVQKKGVDGPCFSLRTLVHGEKIAQGPLRVLVADRGPLQLHSKTGELQLRQGDVVLATAADGEVEIVAGSAAYFSEPMS